MALLEFQNLSFYITFYYYYYFLALYSHPLYMLFSMFRSTQKLNI